MANEVQILIKAVDQASGTLKKINGELTKSGTTAQSVAGKFKSLLSSPTAMIGAVGAVAGAMTAAGVAVKGLADDFQDYAFQVKDFGRIIGATPEEASKLIQVADDVRLSVGSMTAAMRGAITKGYSPSIEGLGKMADAYNAIVNPIEKSRFLVETFGRSGLEMAKLLELGSTKIREMGDSIEGTGLLMTQSGVDAATEYYQAIDTLGDSWTSLTQILGREAAPAITKVVNALNDFVTESQSAASATRDLENAVALGLIDAEEYQQAIDRLSIKDTELYTILRDKAVPIMEEYNKKFEDILPDMNELIRKTSQAGEETDSLGNKQDAAGEKALKYAGALDGVGAAAEGNVSKIDALNGAFDRTATVFDTAKSAIDQYVESTAIAAQAEERLSLALGKTTLEQLALKSATELATSLMADKIITLDAWVKMLDMLAGGTMTAVQVVQQLRAAINSLPEEKQISIYVNTYGTGYGVKPGKQKVGGEERAEQILNPPGGAHGLNMVVPPGYPNDTFPIRASSGEQVIITPQGKGSAGGWGSANNGGVYFGDIIINAAPGQSETAIANAVIRKINQSMRAGSRSGLGYTG